MKKQILVVTGLLFTAIGQAQQEIKIDDLNKHIGDSITI